MTDKLEEIFGQFPTKTTFDYAGGEFSDEEDEFGRLIQKRKVAVFSFSKKGFGFGEITITSDKDGNTFINSECTSRETVKEILCSLVDDAVFEWEEND